ncbi:NTP transferase domain-containing protein [candidate division KSB1 bacterium]
MSSDEASAVILAAGKSSRMKSGLTKLLHEMSGRPLVQYVAEACLEAGIGRVIIVIGHNATEMKAALGDRFEYVYQRELLGTGHALMQAEPVLKDFHGDVCVFVGDAPFLTAEVIRNLTERHRETKADCTLLSAVFPETPAYGRIVRDGAGAIRKIVEEKDTTPEERAIREVNTSHYCFNADRIMPLLSEIKNDNVADEYYLTDVIEIALDRGYRVETVQASDYRVGLGINNRIDFAQALRIMYDRKAREAMTAGVTLIDPATTYIDNTVEIDNDVIIYPGTFLEKGTKIGKGSVIGPGVYLSGTDVGRNCTIRNVGIVDEKIGDGGLRTGKPA